MGTRRDRAKLDPRRGHSAEFATVDRSSILAIEAYWSADVASFLDADPAGICRHLAHEAQRNFRINEVAQLNAWAEQCHILRSALRDRPAALGWQLMFEVSLPRLGRRADAVLLTARSIVVMEFKTGETGFSSAGREQADDFALDLQDFHAGSRGRTIVPMLVANGVAGARQAALVLGGVQPVIDATPAMLGPLLGGIDSDATGEKLEAAAWRAAPYRPVPPIIQAACNLYARHDVADIVDAKAGSVSLATTTRAILEALADARDQHRHTILFVTGVPGAGKTLCGLNACFGAAADDARATFLTGNPSLVHVLREALVRDACRRGMDARSARQRMEGVIQKLPWFRDTYVRTAETPPERVVVIDEAQRSWSRDYAIRKSRDRAPPLTKSEPAHLLDAMGRHDDWSAIICLVGGGQEIHDGEGGLAEWGTTLATEHAHWQVVAAPDCLTAADPRRRLPMLPMLRTDPRLHLSVATRQIGHPTAADWVETVLDGNAEAAAGIAAISGDLPYLLTRDLTALRSGLRMRARGTRRAGLVASSGAHRLRAEGLGVELPHMDAGAVASWFLDRWPEDVRASDALEVVATEFSAQGLELDVVGLCWDGDLIRGAHGWQVRSFRGTDWQNRSKAEGIANRINTYRVLLTRSRHDTIIWVPRGDAGDRTRPPAVYDAIATFLIACGVRPLERQPQQLKPALADLFGG